MSDGDRAPGELLQHDLRRWFAEEPGTLAWRTWGDEFVFHVGSTGSTHLIDAQAGQIVLELMELSGGATAAELLARFEMDNPAGEADIHTLEQLLQQLEQVGLTRSVPL